MIDFTEQQIISSEVYHSRTDELSLSGDDIRKLIHLAEGTSRGRVRFCIHRSRESEVQQMFIVHPMGAYVRPHKHIAKIESILVIKGEADYVVFDDQGSINNRISMGDFLSSKPFYHTIGPEVFHTLLIRSDWLVFLEITKGPFVENDTLFAEWSPDGTDLLNSKNYTESLN